MVRWAGRLALVSSVTLAAWTTTGIARSSTHRAGKTSDQPLRVAIVIPKSGSFSIHNRLIANGAIIAAKELNTSRADKGRVHLQLSVVRVRPAAAPKRIVRTLVRASTHVLILPCNVALQEPLARTAAKAGLLTLSPCNPDSTLAKRLRRYWPTGATGSAEAGQLVFYARYIYKPVRTAFLLGSKSWYSRRMTGELRKAARRNSFRVVGKASVPTGSRGLAKLAKLLRKADPGIVFATVPSPRIESVISGLRANGVHSAFFVTDGMDASINFDLYRDGPDNSSLEDVVFGTFGFPRPASVQFVHDYSVAYGKEPLGSFPGLGYETVQVLEAAAKRAAAPTPAGLNAAFARGFTVKGVALEDISYQGHGRRQPVTYVGLAEVIRDGYVPLFVSEAGHPTG